MPDTPETHRPCGRCKTTDVEVFDSPTSAYCSPCWAIIVDPSAAFHRFADRARGLDRAPFFNTGRRDR
jgi:hypothetical protein